MGRLTTHILDTARGRPGNALQLQVDFIDATGQRHRRAEATTNDDGRCDRPLLEGEAFTPGEYEITFHAGDYLDRVGGPADGQRFLDRIVIRFGVADASEHFHVPLLLSPFGYSTYRGS